MNSLSLIALFAVVALTLAVEASNDHPIHACANGLCPEGFVCNSKNNCVVRRLKRGASCPERESIGDCLSGLCPAGFACDSSNKCCLDVEAAVEDEEEETGPSAEELASHEHSSL